MNLANWKSQDDVNDIASAHPIAHWIIWATVLFFLAAIIWASFAELEEITHADGRVIPSRQTQIIQNLEGGILSQILVKSGEQVEKGQVLLQIDDTRFASSFFESQSAVNALRFRIMRLEAEYSGQQMKPPVSMTENETKTFIDEAELMASRRQELESSLTILQQQLQQHKQTKQELQSDLQKLKKSASYAQQELSLTAPLVNTGAVSQVELLRLKSALNEAEGRVKQIELKLPGQNSIISEAEQRLKEREQQFKSLVQEELTANRSEFNSLNFSNIALEDRVARTEVRSPVDGIINQLFITTESAVIQPGMDLLEIVPLNDTLLVNAKVRPIDIAFIRPGQKASVKLTAYDFSIYGSLDATLEQISADTITDETGEHFFQIRVRTSKAYLGPEHHPLPIMSGMTATVDINTGKKTVMDYLLKPLKRATATAMTER